MPCRSTTSGRTLIAALWVLALTSGVAPPVPPALADEAGDAESDATMRGRRQPEEPAAEPQYPVKPLGVVRRPDPFEAAGDPPPTGASGAPAAARPDHGAVICEAGCDGPSGSVVYKSSKPAG